MSNSDMTTLFIKQLTKLVEAGANANTAFLEPRSSTHPIATKVEHAEKAIHAEQQAVFAQELLDVWRDGNEDSLIKHIEVMRKDLESELYNGYSQMASSNRLANVVWAMRCEATADFLDTLRRWAPRREEPTP